MNNISRWDPFSEISALQKQLFDDNWLTPVAHSSFPATDIYTQNDTLVVETYLPNFAEKDVDIQVDNGSLSISANRHETESDKKYLVRESSSSFYRRIALPERANVSHVTATLDNSTLKVSVPLTALPEPKKVAISTKAAQK